MKNNLLCIFIFLSPVAIAANLPTNGQVIAGNANIITADKTMIISSTNTNNIIKWECFDIAKDYELRFDYKNYLNIVTSTSPSMIAGKILSQGNVFIVNPNGINLLTGSTVNVTGKFGLSTAKIGKNETDAFLNTGILTNTYKGMGKVRLLGTIKAQNLYIDGSQIIIRDLNDITSLHTGQVLNNKNEQQVHLASSTKRIDIGSTKAQDDIADLYQLNLKNDGLVSHAGAIAISTEDEFLAIQNNLSGNYWLTSDLDFGLQNSSIIDDTFKGTFDGAYNKITYSLETTQAGQYGLFTELNQANISNLKLQNVDLNFNTDQSITAGALAATINQSNISNIEIENLKISTSDNANVKLGGVSAYALASNFTNINSSFNQDSENLLNQNIQYGTLFYEDDFANNYTGVISGNSVLNHDAIYTQKSNALIFNQFDTAIDYYQNNLESFTEHYIYNDQSLSQFYFLKPYFAEDYESTYNGKDHNYLTAIENPYFDNNIFVDFINPTTFINAGNYQVQIQGKNEYYVINTNNNKGYSEFANITIHKKNLGNIIINNAIKDSVQLPTFSIANEDSLNFAENDNFADLNLEFSIIGNYDVIGVYDITLKGDSQNYNYTVSPGKLTVTYQSAHPILNSIDQNKINALVIERNKGICTFCKGSDQIQKQRIPAYIKLESSNNNFKVANSDFDDQELKDNVT